MDPIEMVYTSCTKWLDDLIQANPMTLVDSYDAATWFDEVVKDAMKIFLDYGFQTDRARNDAILILRALFYEHYLFMKQFSQTQIKPNLDAWARLEAAPQSVQKSATWHAESYNMISGHEFGAICVGGPAERNSVIEKKCAPPVTILADAADSKIVYLTSAEGVLSPFKWGWRYEPVARDVFEAHHAEGKVIDTLGRLRHTTLPRLGASPDGLIISGPRCGRLVELKCPSSRLLDGTIPMRYYCQMQLQAEVCDVDAVEYFECAFASVPVLTNYILSLAKLPYVGKLCVIGNEKNEPTEYIYSPLFPATKLGISSANQWTAQGTILETCCWYVKDSHHSTVLRNKRWWNTVGFPAYTELWKEIDKARESGKYKRQALFVDDATTVASDHGSVGTEVVADENTSDAFVGVHATEVETAPSEA
jgi:hypothetical protein